MWTQISSVTYGVQMKAIFTLMAISTDKQLIFLGFDQPDDVVQKPLHNVRVMIWCIVSGHGILGPCFVEDDTQNPLTVNQEHYREIISAPFVWDLKLFAMPETCHCKTCDDSGCSKMEL